MPVLNWNRVKTAIFHDFQLAWVVHLSSALNEGLLPPRFYALVEQQAGHDFTDLMSLQTSKGAAGRGGRIAGGPNAFYRAMRRALAIRHESDHRLVALIEILSPVNMDRPASVADFVAKAHAALRRGVHLLIVDLFGPGLHAPEGMHGAIWASVDPGAPTEPTEKLVTLIAYVARQPPEAYLESADLSDPLPDMPLFLEPEIYVQTPLESTYLAAYRGFPSYWRGVLEGEE